jgi:hypothetical protein
LDYVLGKTNITTTNLAKIAQKHAPKTKPLRHGPRLHSISAATESVEPIFDSKAGPDPAREIEVSVNADEEAEDYVGFDDSEEDSVADEWQPEVKSLRSARSAKTEKEGLLEEALAAQNTLLNEGSSAGSGSEGVEADDVDDDRDPDVSDRSEGSALSEDDRDGDLHLHVAEHQGIATEAAGGAERVQEVELEGEEESVVVVEEVEEEEAAAYDEEGGGEREEPVDVGSEVSEKAGDDVSEDDSISIGETIDTALPTNTGDGEEEGDDTDMASTNFPSGAKEDDAGGSGSEGDDPHPKEKHEDYSEGEETQETLEVIHPIFHPCVFVLFH